MSHRATANGKHSESAERVIPLLRSCERCRRRKQRCDGEQPVCGRCKSHRAECSYRESGRFRKRFPRSSSSSQSKTVDDHTNATLSAATTLSSLVNAGASPICSAEQTPLPVISAPRLESISEVPESPDASVASTTAASGYMSATAASVYQPTTTMPGYQPNHTTSGYLHPQDPRTSMLFSVPDLSPSLGTDLSPNHPIINTPVGAQPLLGPTAYAIGSMIDPVHVLKTQALPDLTHGLPENILHQMWALIGGLDNSDSDLGTLNSAASVHRNDELPPNMDLLDPRNRATNARQTYTMDNMSWLQGDPLQNLEAAADYSDSESAGPLIGSPISSPISSAVPLTLSNLAQRYQLHEQAATLLAMLKASFVDSDTKIRTRQFWVTLESGNISDFVLLAHLTIAAREAQLSSKITLQHPQSSIEGMCYDASRREWDAGRVEATTGAVYALLLLSEYGFQIGRYAVLWEFAHNALATARRIVFRHIPYPWRDARRAAACDVEYEHVLSCYWSSWARVLTAAQTMTRRVDVSLYAPDGDNAHALPEFPRHDMCHYTAQPTASVHSDTLNTVSFADGAPCCFRPYHSYSAATWRCSLMSVEMHNHYIDLLERRCASESYFDALRAWDERMQKWHAAWPPEWHVQMDEMMAVARRVNNKQFGGHMLLENTRVVTPKTVTVDPDVYRSQRATAPETVTVGSHLFHQSQMTAADMWLSVLVAMYETSRLRAYRIALALLQRMRDAEPNHTSDLLLPRVAVGHQYDEQLRKVPMPSTTDPLRDAMEFHRGQFVCLDAARNLQTLFTTVELLGSSPQHMGIWAVFVLEHVIAIHCTRLLSSDTSTQIDALRRLALLVRQLLTLKRWTSALYVFTSIVKAFVEPSHIVNLPNSISVESSPWPANHVLTLLMHEMNMDSRKFCAFTVPVVYASMMSSTNLPPSMRMRIASLLS
ncbi:hypothetical protein IWW49_004284 [Coemansia sp. RSA 1797]|nr:hypothetical protein IWW49_004284 [Coemansia sp. RSA 1797]